MLHPVVINLIYPTVLSLSLHLIRIKTISYDDMVYAGRQQPHVSYCALKDDDSTFSSLLNLIMLDRAWQNNYTNSIVIRQHLLNVQEMFLVAIGIGRAKKKKNQPKR